MLIERDHRPDPNHLSNQSNANAASIGQLPKHLKRLEFEFIEIMREGSAPRLIRRFRAAWAVCVFSSVASVLAIAYSMSSSARLS